VRELILRMKSPHRPEWLRKARKSSHVMLFKPAWVWNEKEERLYGRLIKGFTLHACSGYSDLGDIKLDIDPETQPTIVADIHHLPFRDRVFDTLICDPPWKGPQSSMSFKDIVIEFVRVARRRIILILGTLYYHIPKPFQLKAAYIVKKAPPLIHLVYVWERATPPLESFKVAHPRIRLPPASRPFSSLFHPGASIRGEAAGMEVTRGEET
jgi:hypothetical protein